jgi:hypothetical protein
MIAYRDFRKGTRMLGLMPGTLESAVQEANAWITAEGVRVVNVETLRSTGGGSSSEAGVRVWYARGGA